MILIILKRLGNMPRLSTIIKTLLLISLVLSAGVFFLLKVHNVNRLTFEQETIHIKRTDYGIPYIKASSFKSAMYAWGYVTAQDRLFQLSFKRLIGKGRVSKYVGSKALKIDKMFRQLNMNFWAEKTAQKMRKENITEYRNFESYVRGINDQVSTLRFLPIEFYFIGLQWEPWTVADMFLLGKLMVWSQSQNLAQEYIRSSLLKYYTQNQITNFLPFAQEHWSQKYLVNIVSDDQIDPKLLQKNRNLDAPPFDPTSADDLFQLGIMEYIDEGRGSNSWVISGNHTKSGKPILANDPHLDNAIPSEWHQIRIEYMHEGRNVYWEGGAMTGLPAIIGKTSYAAFGLTTIYVDTQDLYKEQIKGDYYILDGKQYKLKKRTEIIQVENEQPVKHVIKETHRGPIINFIGHHGALYEVKNSIFSLAWTGFNDEYQAFMSYSHAAEIQNIQQLKKLMTNFTDYGPNMNLVYTTRDNHIGYCAVGVLPLRRNPSAGNFIKDGSISQHDWIGLIKDDQKLCLHDPEKGFIVTANNKPVSTLYQQGVYQSSISTARANRITQLILEKIQGNEKFTVEDMKKMQLDTVDIMCKHLLPFILQGTPKSKKYLQNFNCNFGKKSYQATIYETFTYQLFLLINPDKNKQFNLMASLNFFSYLGGYIMDFRQTQNSQKMELAFDLAIKNLTSFYGTEEKQKWIWEQYHPDKIVHRPFSGSDVLKPFYEKSFGGRGNIHTVNVAKMNRLSYGDFTSTHRANIRVILSHLEKSYWITDTGVSQKFYSKHYDDQFKLFTKDEYLQIDFQTKDAFPNDEL